MAVCYHVLNHAEKEEAVMAYLKTQMAADGSIPAADRDGVSTGFAISGTESPQHNKSNKSHHWFCPNGENPLNKL